MKFRRKNPKQTSIALLCLASLLLVSACGGGGGSGGGGNRGGGQPGAVEPPPATIRTYDVILAAADVPDGSSESGSATARVIHNVTESTIDITLTLSDMVAEAVALRRGYAGDTGAAVYNLVQGSSATEWRLDSQPITAADAGRLEAGALYLGVSTAANPDGAVRGQVLPQGIDVARFALEADQVASGSESAGNGTAWATFDANAATVTVHVTTRDLGDADGAYIGQALAGRPGPVLAMLVQDSIDNGHWYLETTDASSGLQAAAAAGELHVLLTTPAQPDGAIRGQYLPAGMELVVAELNATALVSSGTARSANGIAGRLMTTLADNVMHASVNLYSVENADRVALHRAPDGQNGPIVAAFEQDTNDVVHWRLDAQPIDSALAAALDNQALYVLVTTPESPQGVARAQIRTSGSSLPADPSRFVVTAIDPPNAVELAALPDAVFVTLNREPLPESVSPLAVTLAVSGGDGSFEDGNEVSITPASVSANGNTIEISLGGVAFDDDVYRITISGDGSNGVVDMGGIPLDGDGDGQPGGVFESAFEIRQPEISATLTAIQAQIFTPSCATSGCHSGSSPPDGLLLTAGDAWSNIVNVSSVQQPTLKRILPGNPDDSYLVRKVQGTGIVASRMPLGAAPLSQEQIDLIRQWVSEGALDN